jgi:hypothetical protein
VDGWLDLTPDPVQFSGGHQINRDKQKWKPPVRTSASITNWFFPSDWKKTQEEKAGLACTRLLRPRTVGFIWKVRWLGQETGGVLGRRAANAKYIRWWNGLMMKKK